MRGANLHGANLANANLEDAYLGGANLECADLSSANLQGANLEAVNLWGANLSDANLTRVYLADSFIWKANLTGASLLNSNMLGVHWRGLRIDGLPYHQLTLVPTPNGWDIRINFWHGNLEQLRASIEAKEVCLADRIDESKHRSYLKTMLKMCEVYMEDHANHIEELKEKWA